MSIEYQTDVPGYIKKKDAVLATDIEAKTAYKKQKKLLMNIVKNTNDIEELKTIINNLMERVEKLESQHSA